MLKLFFSDSQTCQCSMSVSHSFNLKWHCQLDVNMLFVHGELEEDAYIKILLGVSHQYGSTQVCKLPKSLYVLKQALWQWFYKFSNTLLTIDFHQSSTDYTIFTKMQNNSFLILCVDVDDIILTCNNLMTISEFKLLLDQQFKLNHLGTLKYFLGLEIARRELEISVSQHNFTVEIH